MSRVANTDDVPSGYRMTELGPLPEEWEVVRLGEVFEEVVERVKYSEYPHAYDLPVLSLTKNEGLILQAERFGKRIATEDVSEYKIVKRGQIVYNPYVIWEGAIHILAKFEAGIVSPVYLVLQTKQDIADPYFFDAWLRTPPAIAAYNRFASGAVNRRRSIKKRDFFQIVAPLPPLPEQKAIAYVLRTVQEAKEKTENVIKALKELKKSLMKHLFTYGPVPLGEVDKVKLKETEVGYIPEHWEVVRLGEVAHVRYGKSKPNRTGSIPVIGSGGVYSWTYEPLVKFPTLVIGRKGTAGQVWLAENPSWPSDTTFYLEWKRVINIRFLHAYLLFSPLSGDHAKTTLPSLQRPYVEKFPIPLPPLHEQEQIAHILRSVDDKIEAERRRAEALDTLFKTLLHDLLTARRRLPKEFVKQFEGDGSAVK